jgi:prepilin-type N-terminal cleavage/methylation domain-containing protein
MLIKHAKGFTLVEIVMTIVLVSVLAAIAAVIILQGVRGYVSEASRSDIHYQTRLAMERMTREVRTIRQPQPGTDTVGTTALGTITGNPTSSLIFTDVTGTDIYYSLSGNTLVRRSGSQSATLATGVTALQFNHYNIASALTTSALAIWTVEIFLNDQQGGDSLSMRTRVHPRSF